MRNQIKKNAFKLLLFTLLLLVAGKTFAAIEAIPVGSKIINMGVAPQTVANGLKPYGLVYALLKQNIPVKWVINQNKVKDGIDFSHNGVDYKSGAFIISKDYLYPSIVTLINTWITKGVVVNTSVSALSLDVTYTIKAAPFWVMDAQNGKIAVQFLTAAEIPSSAYIFKDPSQLTGCDDIYVMPHADPTWSTHKNLYYWNKVYKGAIWAGCHAVSVMENTYGPDSTNGNATVRLNFLSSDGTSAPDKNLVLFSNHSNGSPPYSQNYPSHAIMQFLGTTDAAQQGGSEQVYMPFKPGGTWRPQTFVGVYDPSQTDVPTKSNGPVASILFGSAYGDPNRGKVVYEGGHDISGTSPANVAAERAFFNAAFLFVLDKQITSSLSNVPANMNSNTAYNAFLITATSPIPNNTLTYQWTSSIGGTFSNPTGITTNYTPPVVNSITPAVITCVVTDACGRVSGETKGVSIIPGPMAPVALPDSAAVPSCKPNITTFKVLDNDYDPNGDPMTVTLLGQGLYGTFKNQGNGVITYTPTSYAGAYDQVQYKNCDNTGLCTTSTITAIIQLKDGNGCNPDQFYGIASTITAALSTVITGSPTNQAGALDQSDGITSDPTSYTTIPTAGNTIIYSLSAAIPSLGSLKFFVDANGNGRTFTVEQSSDSTNWTNATTFTVNSSDDFLDTKAKAYTVVAGTKWIRLKVNIATIYLDAMEYQVWSCISSSPTTADDRATTLEDVPVTIDVLSNDSDPLGNPLFVSGIAIPPTHGSVSINPDKTVTYLNTKDVNLPDSFTYIAINPQGLVSTAKAYIKIVADACANGKYQAYSGTSYTATIFPIADNYLKLGSPTSNFGTSSDFRLKGQLNDLKRPLMQFDFSSIPSNAIIDSAILYEYLSNSGKGEIADIYRMTTGWTETGSTWNSYDGINPWATAGGDYDPAVWSSNSLGNSGTIYLNWNIKSLVQGWVSSTYPNYGFMMKRYPEASNGTFNDNSIKARENGASTTPKLFIKYFVPAACTNIPNRAVMAMPDTVSTNSVTPITINVGANDFDYSNKGFTIQRISLTSSKGGTITQAGSQLTYTPPNISPAYNGVDTFMYRASAGPLDDSAWVYVNVTNAPPNANADTYTLPTNTTTAASSITSDVRINDSDPELSTLTLPVITIAPKRGVASVDAAGKITYTPALNYFGKDTLVYQVGEAFTGCNPNSDTALVIYTITNRAPVGVNDSISINACEIKQINVLNNDYDPEGGTMTISIVQAPGLGSAAVINNGTVIQYSPPSGTSNVTTTLTYQVCDNVNPKACNTFTTVTITIKPPPVVNNAPIAANDNFYAPLNNIIYADVLSNDVEPDGQLFSVPLTIVTNPTRGTAVPLANGLIKYTANQNAYGVDSFQYRVFDSLQLVAGATCPVVAKQSATAWAYIVIQNSPIAYNDYKYFHKNIVDTINVTGNDIFGADGPATGTITIITPPNGGTAIVLPGTLSTQIDDKIKYVPNNGFAANDTIVYQICDGNGDCTTGVAYIRFYPDTDKDGIDDINDIDDDNDGIPDYIETCGAGATGFSCLPNGSDPSADDDLDGIVNYQDADYGPLNSKGCVASLDLDGDGIPDYLDLDSDNDGIADVVEAFGADSNGDGIIDNYKDTDGDGLSQNVDANNTGAAGSGDGLGFIDTDGDGIPNTLDLDSDNDGIPDIVEVLAPDANNDGLVDTYKDSNANGWNDPNEGAGSVLQTGADTDNDGRANSYPNRNGDQTGKPNPYDLDSDGDGITDAAEAGFPPSVTISNGIVSGARTNGWANSVRALGVAVLPLANTDNRGPANFLDIDSDDDGISDNIEGQSTTGYVVPTSADADGDGLADVYDNAPAEFGGSGIVPNDQDSDGIPDYKDSDADNDGLSDLVEASNLTTLTQANINTTDTDGDGMLDQFDILNLKTAAAAAIPFNVTSSVMGASGSTTGPAQSGSNVLLVQSLPSYINRDWRIVNTLTLGNQVWYDFNLNGIKEAGETGISGVIVNLYADANGDNIPDGGALISTTTDATGTYQFTGLSATKYIVGVIVPSGYVKGTVISSSSDPNNGTDNDNNGLNTVGSEIRSNYINLTVSSNTLDVGLKGTSTNGDFVWYDVNANGIQDPGEIGLAGVTVTATNSGGVSITAVSDGNGFYTFPSLAAGTYTIVFTAPAGYVASPALQGSDPGKDSDPVGGSVLVTLSAGQIKNSIDAGFYQLLNLGNIVWYDVNMNGLKDAGEPIISGATVRLYLDANNDNVPDGAAIATTTTNASGVYAFSGLAPNNYIIGVVPPAGYTINAANGGDPDNDIDNDNNGVNLVSGEVRSNAITLINATEPTSDGDGSNGNLTLDFGLKGAGSIGDFIWNDLNGNGVQESGEPGLAGITVTATSAAIGSLTITATSDVNGYFSFQGLFTGTYTLTFSTPSGYFASPANQGSDPTVNSVPTGGTASVAITAGQNRTDIDAGYYIPFTIGNAVFYDVNANGVRDAQDVMLPGVTVKLYADTNGDNNADGAGGGTVLATTTTDANGNYQFTNIASGKYIVGVVPPAGYGLGVTVATSTNPNNGVDDDNNGIKIANFESRTNYISVNGNTNTLDIGLGGTGSIGDFVWNDINGNGVQDGGTETGLSGVTVSITTPNGVTLTTTTNSSGAYAFSNLAPGTYTVSFTTPGSYYASPALKGSNTAKDSDPVNGSVSVGITAGQARTDIDAGFYVGFYIANKVWYDLNNDGLLSNGETGVPGVTLKLYTDSLVLNTPDGPAIATTTTDATGTYKFDFLLPGKYMVAVVLPAGYTQGATTSTSSNPDNGTDNDNNGVTLVSGEVRTNNITLNTFNNTIDIGLTGSGSIGDFVFNDLNNDGIQNAGEPGLSGVSVTITTASGATITTTTNASGFYSFTRLLPGTYTVSFTTPTGYVASAAAQGADGTKDSDPVSGSATVTLAADQLRTDIDAGFFVPSTLGNLVWYDYNNNGLKDANELVVTGATVKLYKDANGDNVPDGAALATTTTNASGIYQFTGLAIGKYIVGVTAPGYTVGTTISGSAAPDNNTDNDNNGITLSASEVLTNFITLNGTNNTLDIGLKGTASIGEYVWIDVNGSGIQDAGELPLPGVSISLTNSTGMILTTVTNSSGLYTFSNLAAGTYTVSFTTPNGYFASPANLGSDPTKNSTPVSGTASVTVTAGQARTDIDAGFYVPFSLGNLVWYDYNSNGVKDANEPGLSGLPVKLYADANTDNNADGGGGGTVLASTTTDANGFYSFSNLAVGNYIVGVAPPTGYVLGTAVATTANPNNNIDNDNNGVKTVSGDVRTNNISLNSQNTTLDIGLIGSGTIGNFVWADANANGLQDDGANSGIGGVTVTLTNSSGLTLTSTTTNSGAYSFSNLIPGTYTLSFPTPVGYYVSPSKVGTDDTKDSDPVNGSVSVTLTNGQTNNNVDAGFYLPYTIGNQVFYDFDNSGTYSSGEVGISDAIVNLYADNNGDNVPDGAPIASTFTDPNGIYQFSGLAAGKYIVGVSANGYTKGATTNNSANANSTTDNDNNGVNLVGSEVRSNAITLSGSTIALDFGLTGTGSIGNYAWIDDNGNGVQDANESPLAGVVVKVTNSGGITLSTTTDALGYYNFPNIAPDTYTLFFKTPNGKFLTGNSQGADPSKDSDPVEDTNGDGSVTVTVGPGEVADYIDAGYFIPFPLGNIVYFDINNNGVKDANEKGIPGLTVNLYDDKNFDNIPDGPAKKTTTTDATGAYLFTDLRANGYIVGVQLPAGYVAGATTSTSADPNNLTDNDNNGVNTVGSIVRTNNINLSTPRYDVDFGLKGTAAVGNFIWFDANNNGIQNAGETGLAGVSVTLTHSTGASVTTTSNASGAYSFTGLIPGTYTLTFTSLTDYSAAPSAVGTDRTIDSDPVNGTVSVTLTAGQVNNDIDAGFDQSYTVGDKIFLDFNNNGTFDAGETGVSGAMVKLYNDANGDNVPDGAAIATTTTNASGTYQFPGLGNGKFIVGVTLPAGYVAGLTTATSANPNNYTDNDNNGVTTVSGEVRTNFITLNGTSNTLDIGLRGTASIGDYVWNDANNGGTQDATEVGIPGATVSLTYSGGPTLTTTTNSSGNYLFANLIPGTYTVTFATPFGYVPSPSLKGGSRSKDSDPVNGVVSVTLTAGLVNNDIDAGFTPSRSLGDVVWYDMNNNGVQDANEPGVAGASVKLYADANADNIPDGAATKSVVTDAYGQYTFTALTSNKYIVGVVLPSGYKAGATSATSTNPNNLIDGDNNGVTTVGSEVRTNYITVTNSTNTLDIGLSGTGSIGDFVFSDANANGIQDAGEGGIANVSISLTDVSSGAVITTTSDASGNYSFTGIAPDTYSLTFTTPSGYTPSPAAQGGNTTLDSDPVNGTVSVTLAAGQLKTDIDAGFYQGFSIGNLVWEDLNNDGIKQTAEKGISGATVKVYVDANGDNTPDGAAIATTITDANGLYQFSNLPLNKYIIGVTIPAGYGQGNTTSTSADPNNNTDNDNNGVSLVNGEIQTNYLNLTGVNTTVDIALRGISSIGNFVWEDWNGNGIQDASEPGIAGVSVTATNSSGNSITVTTNSSGFYSLQNLPAGTYTVTFATPSATNPSPAAQGSDRSTDSDPVNGSVTVTLAAGQTRTDIDAGFYTMNTLGNAVWFDFNKNGLKDAGESGISGATVKLYADANGDNVPDGAAIATTTTNSTGTYQFVNVAPGKYIVGVVAPTGYAIGNTTATSLNPNNNTDNDNNGVNVVGSEIRSNYISLSTSNNTLDFGLRGTGSIGDFVWNDINGNGIQDAGEVGIPNVIVSITNIDGMTLQTNSDASSNYAFTNLGPGNYLIAFTPPSGYIASPALQGTDRTKDSKPSNGTVAISLLAGEARSDVDAGFYVPFTLGNRVWYDLNNNGTKDAGETGINGATVNLYADVNADNIADGGAIATTTADTNGFYHFANLQSGKYIVGVVVPTGFDKGTTTATSNSPDNYTDNDNNGVNLNGGEVRSNYITINGNTNTLDIGLKGGSSISSMVWLDADGNNLQDPGEAGIAGVTVTLSGSNSLSLTTTTDANGYYSFASLTPGTYTIHFQTPTISGAPKTLYLIARKANIGSDPNIDSDPDPSTGNVTVTLAAGASLDHIDAGFAIDNDYDKDGIPNIVESKGYDPFADGDGDGIPNYKDPTQINGIPGKPLIWKDVNNDGINDWFDFDLDGILNELDLDSDNDGILDIQETRDARATDVNNDGMADGVDNDGDGILSSADQDDNVYGNTGLIAQDMDGDTNPNFLDLDSDGDGITDYTEATGIVSAKGMITGADTDGDGILGESFGSNSPIVADNINGIGGKGISLRDSDGDGKLDAYDIDSDGDGITDNKEGQTSAAFVARSYTDTDGDGIDDSYDTFNGLGATGIIPADFDTDGVPDYLDLDTDNDGIVDNIEWQLGSAYVTATTADTDGDGLVDVYDILPNTFGGGNTPQNSDGDGLPDFRDRDSDNDGIPDVVEAYGVDTNGDGIIDNFTDTDADGLSQNIDANNTGNTGSGLGLGFVDLDGDGVRNSVDLDADNDGIPDIMEAGGADVNNDGKVDGFTDANNNGLHDAYEMNGALIKTGSDGNNDGKADSYPNKNTDGSGLPNPYDLDSDGDGLPDQVEAGFAGSGGIVSGTIGANGWSSTISSLAALNLLNTDGTGPLNYLDLDSDDDGIGDNYEWQQGAYIAPAITDSDNDGIADVYDSAPNTYGGGKNAVDTDNDGKPDYIDLDSDNDGIADNAEWQLMSTYVAPTITDTDNDGILDVYDAAPNAFGGIKTPLDSDGDGVFDFRDKDSDNDGVADVVEAFGADTNGDGVIDNFSDTDGDGLSDNVDGSTGYQNSGLGLGYVDFDGDGIANFRDLDSDNDGIPDIVEVGGVDANNNGMVDTFADSNGNGWADSVEGAASLLLTGADINGDGKADSYPYKNADQTGKPNLYDLDADGDGIVDAVEAGFANFTTVSNGQVSGPKNKGWATAISARPSLSLVNTDGRGPADYLDIDSDDDGISDNVEGQPTFSYIIPSDNDTDGDGVADVYDLLINSYGSNGITPYDHDSDGMPDYIDTDTDNDGAPDINEASMVFTLTQTNINLSDTDGDGLLDEFDNLDINSLPAGAKSKNVTNSKMGTNGVLTGPLPSGSNVKLVRSLPGGDRDWRASYILPLQIITFTGTLQKDIAQLQWKVQNEQEVDHYVVERSKDALTFEAVGQVKAKNNPVSVYDYPDDITSYNSDKVYYRIGQVNKAGEVYYSKVITFLKETKDNVKIKAYPNPVRQSLVLDITCSEGENTSATIFDATGRAIQQKSFELIKGENVIRFSNVASLAKGWYTILVFIKGKPYNVNIIKE